MKRPTESSLLPIIESGMHARRSLLKTSLTILICLVLQPAEQVQVVGRAPDLGAMGQVLEMGAEAGLVLEMGAEVGTGLVQALTVAILVNRLVPSQEIRFCSPPVKNTSRSRITGIAVHTH